MSSSLTGLLRTKCPKILKGMVVRSHNHRWDEKAQSWRCKVMDKIGEIFFTLFMLSVPVGFAILIMMGMLDDLRKWWRKYSRKSYYLKHHDSKVDFLNTSASLRGVEARRLAGCDGFVIEVGQSPFRKAGAIYGSRWRTDAGLWIPLGIPIHWRIDKTARSEEGDFVSLTDDGGLKVETALRMINSYPSLQAMLDRIAELDKICVEQKGLITQLQREHDLQKEKNDRLFNRYMGLDIKANGLRVKFGNAFDQLHEMKAAIQAILFVINSDRAQYRSKAAERIRKSLEYLDYWKSGQPFEDEPENKKVEEWRNQFARILYSETVQDQ